MYWLFFWKFQKYTKNLFFSTPHRIQRTKKQKLLHIFQNICCIRSDCLLWCSWIKRTKYDLRRNYQGVLCVPMMVFLFSERIPGIKKIRRIRRYGFQAAARRRSESAYPLRGICKKTASTACVRTQAQKSIIFSGWKTDRFWSRGTSPDPFDFYENGSLFRSIYATKKRHIIMRFFAPEWRQKGLKIWAPTEQENTRSHYI